MAASASNVDNLVLIRNYGFALLDAGTPQQFDLRALQSAVDAGGGQVHGGREKQMLKSVCKEILQSGQLSFVRRWRAKKLLDLIEEDTHQKHQKKWERFTKSSNNSKWGHDDKQILDPTQRWPPTAGVAEMEDSVAVDRLAAEAVAHGYILDKMVEGDRFLGGAKSDQGARSSVLDDAYPQQEELREPRPPSFTIARPASNPPSQPYPVVARETLDPPPPPLENHILRPVPANVQLPQGAASLSKVVKTGFQNVGVGTAAKFSGEQDPTPDKKSPMIAHGQPRKTVAGAEEGSFGTCGRGEGRADVQVADEMSSNRAELGGGIGPPVFDSLWNLHSDDMGPFWFGRQLAGQDGFPPYAEPNTSDGGETGSPGYSVESGAGDEMADSQESGGRRTVITGPPKRSWEQESRGMEGRAKRASLGGGQWASAVPDTEMQHLADGLFEPPPSPQPRSDCNRAPSKSASAAFQNHPKKKRHCPHAPRLPPFSTANQTPPAAVPALETLPALWSSAPLPISQQLPNADRDWSTQYCFLGGPALRKAAALCGDEGRDGGEHGAGGSEVEGLAGRAMRALTLTEHAPVPGAYSAHSAALPDGVIKPSSITPVINACPSLPKESADGFGGSSRVRSGGFQLEPIFGRQPEQDGQRHASAEVCETVGGRSGAFPGTVALPFKKRKWRLGLEGGSKSGASERRQQTTDTWEGDECREERAARGGERKWSPPSEGEDGERVRQAWDEMHLNSAPPQETSSSGGETKGDWEEPGEETGQLAKAKSLITQMRHSVISERKSNWAAKTGWSSENVLRQRSDRAPPSQTGELSESHVVYSFNGCPSDVSSAPWGLVGPPLEGGFWDGLPENVRSVNSFRGAPQSGPVGDDVRSEGLESPGKGPGDETWSGNHGGVGVRGAVRRPVQIPEQGETVPESNRNEGFERRGHHEFQRRFGRRGLC
ncbi:hypothetical protein KFL_008900010 [Klebsormidium nitens]|uniref:Uncharacterized protein n=1 Tax=Klebsormidium nitens TaxID=105231 RepID=A0A1Y1IMD1_KLENI|nr:hypothetical protein KFL_008900010 [Klebsormidium nitens]|eukprot:GAQ91954.1 hypothetical protein KFL_008900010 [Klebsormidium nitens]